MFSKKDPSRNGFMLDGSFAHCGYDWWWHSLTAVNEKTKEEKAFFFEYFTCNPALGKEKPIFGQLKTDSNVLIKPSYLMVKAGCWQNEARQLHRFFAWNDVKMQKNAPFHIVAGDCYCSDDRICGSISLTDQEVKDHPEYMCDAGDISWNLTIRKVIPFNVGYGASKLFRAIKAFEMYWHAEGMKSLYSGTITYNGETYIVKEDTSYGYADKNWGRGFTSPWVWLSSSDLTSRITHKKLNNSVFDIGGGKPKIYFIPLNRKLLSAFYYEGKEYEFNFSKFWTLTRTTFDCKETDDEIIWYVKQETTKAMMETEVHCNKCDMLWVNYEAPDGSKRHNRLWNGGNGVGTIKLYEKHHHQYRLIDEIEARHIGCEYGEYDK